MDQKETKKKKGGCLKVGIIVLLVLILGIAAAALIWYKSHEQDFKDINAQKNTVTYVGQTMPEFEATTTDGETVSLGSLMDGKDVTVVVLFATWCGPCEKEFPFMDEIYKKYQDRMSMIALDIDSLDDEKAAKEYADSHGFSFPIAYHKGAPEGISTSAYPTTLIIDRNGKIGVHRVGSIPDAETFDMLVSKFMGDDYQETQVGYYTFAAYSKSKVAAGTEFTVTSESGTKSYTTGEDGMCSVFTDKPEDLKVKVTSVPEGFTIDGSGEIQSGIGSTVIQLPVK